MSEEIKPDPWALLASDLGVEVPPEEEKPQTPPASASSKPAEVAPPARQKPTFRSPPPEPKKSAADWLRLAGDLGVQVPKEALSAKAPEPPSALSPTWEPADGAILAEVVEEPTESDDVDRWQSESGVEVPQSPLESGEKKLRKRRKRRRKVRREGELGRLQDAAERPGQPIESAELAELAELAEESETDTVEESSSVIGVTSGESDSVELTPQRSKRRRRRRSGRKRSAAASEQGDDVATGKEKPIDDAGLEPDGLEELDVDEAEEDDAQGSSERKQEKLKAIHRGIPSWQEAIGVVIATNMESRSKYPDHGSFSRPRGGRKRNGREKPSSEK